MRKRDLNRAIAETTIRRAFRDMEHDSRRTTRNLLDLGLLVLKRPMERKFLTRVRDVLDDPAGPFYLLLERTVAECDRDTLVTLSVNLGLEGILRGAAKIRESEEVLGVHVPWMIRFSMGANGLSRLLAQRLVTEGKSLGIRVYAIEDCGCAQEDLELLLRDNPTCDFALFTTGERGRDWDLASMAKHHNVLFSVGAESPIALAFCRALRDAGMPFGVHLDYTDENAGSLSLLGDEALALGSQLLFFRGDDASEGLRRHVYGKLIAARDAQECTAVPVDIPGDVLAVDGLISGNADTLTILPDGTAVTGKGNTGLNVRNMALKALLMKAAER